MACSIALVQVFCLSGNVKKRGKLLALKFSLILFSAEKVDQQNKNGLLGDKQKVFLLKISFSFEKVIKLAYLYVKLIGFYGMNE